MNNLTTDDILWAKQFFGDDAIDQKSFPASQAAQLFLTGNEGSGRSASRPNRPYAQVEVVFACVEKTVNAILGLPLMLSLANEKIIESGPAWEFFQKHGKELLTQIVGNYALTRDVFIVVDVPVNPTSVMVINGQKMKAVTSDRTQHGELVSWEYQAGSKKITVPLNCVQQIKNFNPYSRFHGIGPLQAASLAMSQSYQASLFNEAALANGGDPGAILTAPGNITDENEVRRLRNMFDARHKGAGNAKRTVLLHGGMDIKTIAMNLVDMQLGALRDMNDMRICSSMGVRPELIGLNTEAQYAQGPAQRDFIYNTIMSLSKTVRECLTSGLLRKFYPSEHTGFEHSYKTNNKYLANAKLNAKLTKSELFAWFDFSQNATVQEAEREVAGNVLKFVGSGVPMNSLIDAYDLPFEKTEAGQYHWISPALVPADWVLEAGSEAMTGPSLPEEPEEEKKPQEDKKTIITKANNEAAKIRAWKNWVTSWQAIEKEYSTAVRRVMLQQQKTLLGRLNSALKKSEKADHDIIERVVFDLTKENGKLRAINQSFYETASELGIRQAGSEILNLTGKELAKFAEAALRDPSIRAALVKGANNLKNVNLTTQKKIAQTLEAGLKDGEGLADLAKRVKATMKTRYSSSLRIARTQTAGGVGSGRHVGMKAAGVKKKAWLTSRDANVRQTHKAAERAYENGIPVNQAFWVGGSNLMYPGDPNGNVANIINCRCVEIAVVGTKLDDSLNIKFYGYNELLKDIQNEK